MKFDFTKNRKARYKIKIWDFCAINADELFFSNKQDAIKCWEILKKKNPKDIQTASFINLIEQNVERIFAREWN